MSSMQNNTACAVVYVNVMCHTTWASLAVIYVYRYTYIYIYIYTHTHTYTHACMDRCVRPTVLKPIRLKNTRVLCCLFA